MYKCNNIAGDNVATFKYKSLSVCNPLVLKSSCLDSLTGVLVSCEVGWYLSHLRTRKMPWDWALCGHCVVIMWSVCGQCVVSVWSLCKSPSPALHQLSLQTTPQGSCCTAGGQSKVSSTRSQSLYTQHTRSMMQWCIQQTQGQPADRPAAQWSAVHTGWVERWRLIRLRTAGRSKDDDTAKKTEDLVEGWWRLQCFLLIGWSSVYDTAISPCT